MSNITLYQLSSDYQRLAEMLNSQDFDVATIADTIEASGLSDAIAQKAHGIELVARTMEAHNPAIDAEITRLTALKAHRCRAAAGLRDYLKTNMVACGIENIETPMFRLRVQDTPPPVEVFEPGLLPLMYMRQPDTPPMVADKKALAAALKSGEDVQGARLVRTQRLVVT